MLTLEEKVHYHRSNDGRVLKINGDTSQEDVMQDSHLLNTINLYKKMAIMGFNIGTEIIYGSEVYEKVKLINYTNEAKKRGIYE